MRNLIIFTFFCLSISCNAQNHNLEKSIKSIDIFSASKHKHGADFSFISNTDVLYSNKFFGMSAAHFEENLGYTAFMDATNQSLFSDIDTNERGTIEMYFRTTDVGAGQANINNQINLQNGYLPSNATVLALRNGDESDVAEIENSGLVNATRNSQVSTTVANLENEYELTNIFNHASTTRFANYLLGGSIWGSRDVAISSSVLVSLYNATIQTISENGFFRNFSHFHWVYDYAPQNSSYVDFLKEVNRAIDDTNSFCYSAGYGEIIEYLWLRENSNVVANLNGNDYEVSVITNTSNIPNYANFSQSLTVEFSSNWAGVSCTNCEGIRKEGGNYYIDILPNQTAIISESASATYYDFSQPVVISQSLTGSTLTVVTDIPTRLSVFYNETGQNYYDTEYVPFYSNTLSTTHSIDLSSLNVSNFDFWIGAISEMKQSSLTEQN